MKRASPRARAAWRKWRWPVCRRSNTPLVRTTFRPEARSPSRRVTAAASGRSLGLFSGSLIAETPSSESAKARLCNPGFHLPRFRSAGIPRCLSEEFFRLLEELARSRLRRVTTDAFEILEQLALLRREGHRHLHVDAHQLVSLVPAAQRQHAFVAQPERRAALRRRRNLQRSLAEQGRHLDGTAQGGERELDRDFAKKIVALPFEEFVLLHRQHDVQVAGRPARQPRLSIASGAQARAGVDAGRNAHVELRA